MYFLDSAYAIGDHHSGSRIPSWTGFAVVQSTAVYKTVGDLSIHADIYRPPVTAYPVTAYPVTVCSQWSSGFMAEP